MVTARVRVGKCRANFVLWPLKSELKYSKSLKVTVIVHNLLQINSAITSEKCKQAALDLDLKVAIISDNDGKKHCM